MSQNPTGDPYYVDPEIRRLRAKLAEAEGLLRTWLADYDNEAWPHPADETRAFLASPKEQ